MAIANITNNILTDSGIATSSLLPYTGATTNVDLGTNSISSSFIYGNGVSGLAGSIYLKQTTSIQDSSSGYSSMSAFGASSLHFSLNNGTLNRRFRINSVNLDGTNIRTYLLPDADGTIALTSDLGAYLPLTGGTLTGALSGTSATFSGDLTIDTNTLFVDSTNNLVGIGGTPSGTYGKLSVFGGLSIKNDNNAKLEIGRYSSGASNSYIKLGANSNSLRVTDNLDQFDIFTITNGGNVGIGTSSPVNTLTIQNTGENSIEWHRSNAMQGMIGIPSASNQIITGSALNDFCFRATSKMLFATGGDTERMRISSSGRVFINCTSTSYSEMLRVFSSTGYTITSSRTGTGSEGHMVFENGNGAVGTIFTSGSSTSYNTSSDYRLKEDLKEINGLEKVSAIKVYDFKWKTDKSRNYGVLAHELAEILPYAVSGEKDGEMMQGVDYSKIVPILVKAIQELNERIKQLENK